MAELRERHKAEERAHLLAALVSCDWRLSAAARLLGVGLATVQRLIVARGLTGELAGKRHARGRPKAVAK